MYTPFSAPRIILRRSIAILAGVITFPVMVFLPISARSRFYSYLHRFWLKNSDKPVWLQQAELGAHELY
ncbi:DUF2517 family protein [uncultured Photobacterium sp.]|uniref:DUF2517 family protein n=1 Tax=uncultured Photobacterium sp. TaxID=173973 RepID=UPI0026352426|nr:DUF2517 family protein [uncultured Photobacterium sp.]